MRSLMFLTLLLVAACQQPPAPATAEVAAVTTTASAAPATPKFHVSPPQAGTVTVEGEAGAIAIPAAKMLLLGVLHDLLGTYSLLHAGNVVVVGSAKVPLVDGGFAPVSFGDSGGPAQSGDRVLMVPKDASDLACGEPMYLTVP
jgi:hypothetical protein